MDREAKMRFMVLGYIAEVMLRVAGPETALFPRRQNDCKTASLPVKKLGYLVLAI
jgi:hypothetical protein